MATKLQCEICGGKLVGMPGGIFECENCGTEYSTAWAKEKIQEITGKVQIEGTVEVTGKVQVEGGTVQVDTSANKEALLKRAFLLLQDEDWNKAEALLEQVLSIDPECADAYLGLVLMDSHLKGPEEIVLVGAKEHNGTEAVRINIIDPGKDMIAVIKAVRAATGFGLYEARDLINKSIFFDATVEQAELLSKAGAKITYDKRVFDPTLSAATIENSGNFKKFLKFSTALEAEKILGYISRAKKTIAEREEKERIERQQKEKAERELQRQKAEEAERQRVQAEEAERRRQERKRQEAIETAKRRIASWEADKQAAEEELANLRGLFTGKRRKELEAQIAKADEELAALQAELKNLG